jgi:Tol biopolymer transport system component
LALTPGTRLGVYEVIASIGAGGMGEVFRARDTKLNRDVALKVLPDSFASDPDRLARFTREAQTLASLNHPNIAHIHGLEESSDVRALVMELVEGEDLSQRIARGAIPIDDALPIAKQIAEALETAHEQGIIHRDLKPANIKVRPDGTVKVLDFGLAKAMEPAAGSSPSMSMSPTLTTPAMTQAGMILGTAAYMAPEQARGKVVDKRADIWAFGVVLYEMLTGTRAFGDEDVSMTLSKILQREPDFDALPSTVPARVSQALRVCLRKDPKQRVGDIRDVRLALEGAFETAVSQASAPETRQTSAAARALPWALAASTLVFATAWLTVWAPWRAETPEDRPLTRLEVDLGADVSMPAPIPSGSNIVISPDGTRLVYTSGTPAKLFTQRLDQPNATELPGTEGATVPFVSPDSQWVGFISGGKVNKISVEGGAMVPLGPVASTVAGASWGDDDNILVSESWGGGLKRIPAGGGPPQAVAALGNGEQALAFPQLLPGGKAILFAADPARGEDQISIEVLTLADHHRKIVARGGNSPRYLPTSARAGHLVYFNKATLFAIPFNLDTLETHGTAVPLLDDVAYEPRFGTAQFDISRTGTFVYRRASGGASAMVTLQWMDPAGKKEPLLVNPGAYRNPRLSPDGTRIALSIAAGGNQDVWVYGLQRDTMTRLTFGGAYYEFPTWSPDGRYVLFSSVGNGIVQARADGAGRPQPLTPSQTSQVPWSFTPDGKRLAYFETVGNPQIWTVPLDDHGGQLTAGTPEPFLKSNSSDVDPVFSPDGRRLAYQSNESGKNEIYVRAFPPTSSGQGGKWQISNSGGTVPRWSPNGRELLYQSGDQIMASSYTVKGDAFMAEKPRVWIAKLGGTQWDLAPDGKRMAVLTPVQSAQEPTQEHEVVFLEHFFDELRRRVPVGR